MNKNSVALDANQSTDLHRKRNLANHNFEYLHETIINVLIAYQSFTLRSL